MPESPRWGLVRRTTAIPGRVRGVVVRLLRQPRSAAEHFAVTDAQVAAVDAKVEALRAELRVGLEALSTELHHGQRQLHARLDHERVQAREADRLAGITAAAIVGQASTRGAPGAPVDGPLVSIVLPVRDRPQALHRAVDSVLAQTYARWELVIVDDGSQEPVDGSWPARFAADPRIILERTPGLGPAGARNLGLQRATGDLVAFLDSDNWWLPHRLEAVVQAVGPDAGWAIDQQLVLPADREPPHVRDVERPLRELERSNFIDLGAVVVRRALLDGVGEPDRAALPFDPLLPRLSDWDLIERLARATVPTRVPSVGQVYDATQPARVSSTVPYGPSFHRVRQRIVGQPAAGLRILAAEWHFPQLTETYIQSDLVGLRSLGAEVEVWTEDGVAVPYEPGFPWRRGRLEDHLQDFRPDLVLSHWLHVGRDHRPVTRELGIPHAVRCHGFDHDEDVIEQLVADPGVVVHLFPHLVGRFHDRPNVSVDPVGFDVHRVAPAPGKDRRLVLRLVAGLLTKDLDVFLLAARRCPDHRFVLGIGHAHLVQERTEVLIERARELDAPVEILTDVDYQKAGALTMDAGIYLHTHGTDHVIGMPISPIEAMATGSVVLARDLPGTEYLVGGALLYRGSTAEARAAHAAALINDTLSWDDERWAAQATAGLDVAWSRHPADLVADGLLRTWSQRLGVRRAERG